jgi:hypothetical protein
VPPNLGSVWAFDQQGTLHIFGIERWNGVPQLRQWWMTPPP